MSTYYEYGDTLIAGDTARAEDVQAEFEKIESGLELLPEPRPTGDGFVPPIHVGNATEATHAANLGQLQALEAQAAQHRDDALMHRNASEEAASESASSASASAASATAASTSQSAAASSAANAAASATKASQWAENAVDVAVEPGKYSAKHWAEKASELATASVHSVNGKVGDVVLTHTDVGAATSVHNHNNATTSAAGYMSAADKTYLDSVPGLLDQKAYASAVSALYSVSSEGLDGDPDTVTAPLFLTSHANCPEGAGNYFYIRQYFYSSTSSNRSQTATSYHGADARAYVRHRYSGTWTLWQRVDNGVPNYVNVWTGDAGEVAISRQNLLPAIYRITAEAPAEGTYKYQGFIDLRDGPIIYGTYGSVVMGYTAAPVAIYASASTITVNFVARRYESNASNTSALIPIKSIDRLA